MMPVKFKSLLLTSLFTVIIVSAATSQQPSCIKVDLQAVSISPVLIKLDPGQSTEIEVVMHNNGPCPIPVGQATAQITINTEHLEIPANIGFIDECQQWNYLTSTKSGNLLNLFFRNNSAELPVSGKFCAFRFTVKAKAKSAGTSFITLASSLSANASTADMNGTNQSANTELTITGKAGEIPLVKKPTTALIAKANECTALLSWSEGNPQIDSIEVESGTDKSNFTKIGSLAPHDASGNNYTYQAEQINAHKYYRLKIIYKDLTFDYSSISEVETKCKVKKGF